MNEAWLLLIAVVSMWEKEQGVCRAKPTNSRFSEITAQSDITLAVWSSAVSHGLRYICKMVQSASLLCLVGESVAVSLGTPS